MVSLNDPAIIAEVAALHDAYERALVANDVAALAAFFWDSPHTVRYGVTEQLYGSDEIARYRQGAVPAFTQRSLRRRSIAVFGADTASVMCELSQTISGEPRQTRQSQLWIRFPGAGWKIASAHVSHAQTPVGAPAYSWDSYATQAAAALGLPIDAAHRAGVVQNLQRTADIVAPLLAFPLPNGAELAPVFTA